MSSERKEGNKLILFGLLGLVSLVWLLWQRMIPFFWQKGLGLPTNLADRGQQGDSYGSLNSLFTGWAFAGVAFTIYLQIRESRAREAERLEQEAERRKREDDIVIEKFDDRFFKLTDVLRLHIQTIQSAGRTGKAAFSMIVEEQAASGGPNSSEAPNILLRYEEAYLRYQTSLGPYFRLLYRIIKFIDGSQIADKESYTGIVRAELGNAEVWLIAINGLTDRGAKFRPLVIKYHLLKHMARRGSRWNDVEKTLRESYPDSAFDG